MWYTQYVKKKNCKFEPVIHYIFSLCGFSIETYTRLQWLKNPVHILEHQCSDKKKMGKRGGGVCGH